VDERRAKWTDRYARGEETHGFTPSPPLPEAIAHATAGDALDLACGAGRHALYLAERGFRVTAVDYAKTGLAILEREAAVRGVSDRIETIAADLSELEIEHERWDLICDFYFLDRTLFPKIRTGLRPGGIFAAAIHFDGAADRAPHRFLLEPGELRRTVEAWGFEVLLEREGPSRERGHSHATSEIVARFPLQ
jgi:SAM-dependent methyltransferase